MMRIGEYLPVLAETSTDLQIVVHGYVDPELFLAALQQASTTRPTNLVGILRAVALEHWLRDSAIVFREGRLRDRSSRPGPQSERSFTRYSC